MALSITPNREKVLLNLKWFVHRVTKAFEMKLLCAVGRTIHKKLQASRSSLLAPPMSPLAQMPSRHLRDPNQSEMPLLRQLLEHQLQQHSWDTGTGQGKDRRSHDNLENNVSPNRVHNRSPLMRVRSLTNSPLFRRLSLPGANANQCQPLFAGGKNGHHTPGNSPSVNGSNGSITSSIGKTSSASNSVTNYSQRSESSRERLSHLFDTTSESERRKAISDFAEQLCVIYEYQLGMLRGLKAVHAAADYISELVLKAIKTGHSGSLHYRDLTPTLLFESQLRPSSASKCIKTCPLNVTGEQLSWRLGDIWTHAGLRHNEVGGENCHNLSIVTHFLSPFTPFGETRRPDIYGYRNLILLPAGVINEYPSKVKETERNTDEKETTYFTVTDLAETASVISENSTQSISDGIKLKKNRVSPSGNKPEIYFDILPHDAATISRSRIRVGTRDDPLNASASSVTAAMESRSMNKPTIRGGRIGETNRLPRQQHDNDSSPTHFHPSLSSAVSLRNHLHRAYRPVFFVIFDRPSVLEHLTECDSFAAFCKRQTISPVMFVNQPTAVFDGKTHPSLYHNFDLFRVTVAGYLCQNETRVGRSSTDNYASNYLSLPSLRNGASDSDLCFGKDLNEKQLSAFDNPGFIC